MRVVREEETADWGSSSIDSLSSAIRSMRWWGRRSSRGVSMRGLDGLGL